MKKRLLGLIAMSLILSLSACSSPTVPIIGGGSQVPSTNSNITDNDSQEYTTHDFLSPPPSEPEDPYKEDYQAALELCVSGDLEEAFNLFESMPEDYGSISDIKTSVEPYMQYVGKWRIIRIDYGSGATDLQDAVDDSYSILKIAYDNGEIFLIEDYYSSKHATHPISTATLYCNELGEFERCLTDENQNILGYAYYYIENDQLYSEAEDGVTFIYARIS